MDSKKEKDSSKEKNEEPKTENQKIMERLEKFNKMNFKDEE